MSAADGRHRQRKDLEMTTLTIRDIPEEERTVIVHGSVVVAEFRGPMNRRSRHAHLFCEALVREDEGHPVLHTGWANRNQFELDDRYAF